ncbi:MAG: hypothetical protein ACI4XM_08720 [Candidatus Coprovivens sp.]
MVGRVNEIVLLDDDFICFKVLVDDEVLEIIQKQNFINAKIYREDSVFVTYNASNIEIEKIDNGK